MRTQIIRTADGSSTLFVPELQEHYHSVNGAVQESMHVFIGAGLEYIPYSSVRIFEMGFGTGLNAILTFLSIAGSGKSIIYHAVEEFPLEWEKVKAMDYQSFLKLKQDEEIVFEKMHTSEYGTEVRIADNFTLRKEKISILDMDIKEHFDLIYFDAFAPDIQPVLWEKPVFQRIYNSMNKGAILVTYCAKGQVRRNMLNCGFEVERLPGPPGKREMLRATKNS